MSSVIEHILAKGFAGRNGGGDVIILTVGLSLRSAKHSLLGMYMPKIDPVDTAASMLGDQFKGSNTTM